MKKEQEETNIDDLYLGVVQDEDTSKWKNGPSNVDFRKRINTIVEHEYTEQEIDEFDITEAINNHPLAKRPTNIRSKMAYKEILTNLKPTKHYLLPGQICVFEYLEPKFKEELEYYDKTPFVLFLGITRTKDDTIREIGLNLHYFPPFTRAKILSQTYAAFKPYFKKYFNNASKKPNTVISYDALTHIMKSNSKLAFGLKMYVPVLRSSTFVLPAKYISTAFYTEGHFSKATMTKVFRFWRQFKA